MLGNDEKTLKGKVSYGYNEFIEESTGNQSENFESFKINNDNDSILLLSNERSLEDSEYYRLPPEETPSYQEKSSFSYNALEEAPEEAGEEETGPLENRVDSKIWKTRAKAYEELSQELKYNSSLFELYAFYVERFISDSHPCAQEKGINVLQIYIEKSPHSILPYSKAIIKILIEKGISSTKSTIKSLSSSIILDFFSIQRDNSEGFIQGLLIELNNKNIKIQSSAINVINSLINAFGIDVFSFEPFINEIEKFAGNSNPILRGEALSFYKECYRWIKESIFPYVEKLKKPQQEELKKAFEEITEIPYPTRSLKYREARKKSESVKQIQKKIEICEIEDTKDIFTRFNEKWADSVLELDKWIEKKQALEILNEEIDNSKLAEKSPVVLVELAKWLIINDANVNVVQQAIKLIGLLAKGQKKYFELYAKQCFPICLSKLKDKKKQIIQEVYSTLEYLLNSVTLEQANDDIKESMEDKTPLVKINITTWLERIFANLPLELLSRSVKSIGLMAKKNTDDSVAEVRTESFKVISIMISRFPETLNSIFADFSAAKMKKIEDISEEKSEFLEIDEKRTSLKAGVLLKQEKSPQKTEKKPIGREASLRKESGARSKDTSRIIDEESIILLSAEEAENIMSEFLSVDTIENLKESSWKDKLDGLQEVMKWINSNKEKISELNEALLIIIKVSVKDWKENNISVIKAAFEIITIINDLSTISKRSANVILTSSVLEKLSETKLTESYTLCLLSLCEKIGPKFIISQIIKNISDCNKPKVVSECLSVICKLLNESNINKIALKELVDYIKNCLNQANPVIKKSAHHLTIKIYSFIGDSLLPLLNDIKETTLKALQEDFYKTQTDTIVNVSQTKEEEEEEQEEEKKEDEEQIFSITVTTDENISKMNISMIVNNQILGKLSDSDWKVRKDGLEDLEEILDKSGKKILPNGLEELFKSLKARLEDSNKSIIRNTLSVIAKLAECLGIESQNFNKIIVPPLLANLADKQSLLRQDALNTIEKWATEAGVESILTYSSTLLMQDNPEIRTSLLNWILTHKSDFSKYDMKPMAPCILSCLQDKAVNIRNAAESLYSETIEYIKFDTYQPYLKDIKPTVLNSLKIIFDKYKMIEEPVEAILTPRPRERALTKNSFDEEVKTPRLRGQTIDIRIIDPGDKEKRLELDARYKWNVEEIRPDYLEKLKEQIKAAFSPDLYNLMFNSDFKKQIDAAGHLTAMIKAQEDKIISYLDLLLKWCWIQLVVSNNTQIFKVVLEIDILIINILESFRYILSDTEAGLLLPVLCDKSGQNNSTFRTMIRTIINNSCKIHSAEKVFAIVVQGINSKNAKSKVECLEELSVLVIDYGIEIASNRDIKFISKQVNSADNNVRAAAVDTMTELFKIIGVKIWTVIGEVPDKVRGILDQRFRSIKAKNPDGLNASIDLSRISKDFTKAQDFLKANNEEKSLESNKNPQVNKKTNETEGNIINIQTTSEKLQRLGIRSSFTEEDEVSSKKIEDKIETIIPRQSQKLEKLDIILDKIKDNISSPKKITLANESPLLLLEENKQNKSIQNLRNAFKERKLQNIRESMKISEISEEILEPPLSPIQTIIKNLENPDKSIELNALQQLSDIILENLQIHEPDLVKYSHEFFQVTIAIISQLLNTIQTILPFSAYFYKVIYKICIIEKIIKSLQGEELSLLCERLLQNLTIAGLEKLGDNNEGEIIVKTINNIVVKIIELASPNEMFAALLNVLTKYKDKNNGKMNGILIKCLLKLAKLLQSVLPGLDIEKLLRNIQKYLIANNSVTDDIGIKATKTIINELVKLIGEEIWTHYNKTRKDFPEECEIVTWITLLLGNNTNKSRLIPPSSNIPVFNLPQPALKKNPQLEDLFQRLASKEFYQSSLTELYGMLDLNPLLDVSAELTKISPALNDKVQADLIEMKTRKNQRPRTCNFTEIQSRLSKIQQKNQPTTNATNNLNTKIGTIGAKNENKEAPQSRIQKFSKK